MLWKDEKLRCRELRELLATLDPGVRVVMLMSQCFSGSFAQRHLPRPPTICSPSANVCGYFASTADRPAYGCYPENRGATASATRTTSSKRCRRSARCPRQRSGCWSTDDSPDVPHTTSDFFLAQLLDAPRRSKGEERNGVRRPADRRSVASNKARSGSREIRQLDRIGHTFGIFSPRSLAELERQTRCCRR